MGPTLPVNNFDIDGYLERGLIRLTALLKGANAGQDCSVLSVFQNPGPPILTFSEVEEFV